MKYLPSIGPRASTIRPQHTGACHNCHAPVSDKFCGQCGQSAQVHVASAHSFIHHFISHYVAAEGKLWHTLGTLLFRPGQLTLEYIRGRRGHYIDPLRLLLTLSLMAFLLMKLVLPATPLPDDGKATASQPPKLLPLQVVVVDSFKRVSPGFTARFEEYQRLPDTQRTQDFFRFWIGTGPSIALLLIPVLAFWLKLAQLGTGWRYGEHMVFSFHLLSFALLAAALCVLLSGLPAYAWMAALATVPLYLLLALRKVYGGNWLLVVLRWGLVGYLTLQSFKLCMWIAFYGKMAAGVAI